jgi:hypothetical protein
VSLAWTSTGPLLKPLLLPLLLLPLLLRLQDWPLLPLSLLLLKPLLLPQCMVK